MACAIPDLPVHLAHLNAGTRLRPALTNALLIACDVCG